MVFWSNLRSKIRNIISRREFEALKTRVDINETNIATKANTNDVVLKNMTSNTTIRNTGNTLLLANIAHIQSTGNNQNVEIRTAGTGGLDMGSKKIKNLANPSENSDAATKNYVDTSIAAIPTPDLSNYYTKPETNTLLDAKANVVAVYTKTETNNLLNNKANSADVYLKSQTYTRSEIDSKIPNVSNYYTKSETGSRFVSLSDTQTIRGKKTFYNGIDVDNTRITSVATPSSSTDAATKGYVDSVIPSSKSTITTESMTFQCRDKQQTGSIAKFYFVKLSGTVSEKDYILCIKSGGINYVPEKWASDYFDLIANSNEFSLNQTVTFTVVRLKINI